MSFVDELEQKIKDATFAVKDCPFARSGQVHPLKVFLAGHGPRLLAAVRLAEECLNADDAINGDEAFTGTPLEDQYFKAIDAYRTACAGDSETGRLNKEKP